MSYLLDFKPPYSKLLIHCSTRNNSIKPNVQKTQGGPIYQLEKRQEFLKPVLLLLVCV